MIIVLFLNTVTHWIEYEYWYEIEEDNKNILKSMVTSTLRYAFIQKGKLKIKEVIQGGIFHLRKKIPIWLQVADLFISYLVPTLLLKITS